MLCEHCKQNQATNKYEKTVDGKKRAEFYCDDCFRRLFISEESGFSLDGDEKSVQREVCPFCGTTAEEFMETGLCGCEKCYQTLAPVVVPAVIQMQGIERHVGKIPKQPNKEREEKPFSLAFDGGRK